MSAVAHGTRRSQPVNRRRYDRVARLYRALEPLYLVFPPARRRAVAALGLRPGGVVLEVGRRGWSNVELVQADATRTELDRELDGVLFSLSYSALPEPRPALARAWERLRPGGRVVVMDMGLTGGGPARLLDPIARLLLLLTPGDPYSDPWSDLAAYGPVATRRFLGGLFYVSAVTRRR